MFLLQDVAFPDQRVHVHIHVLEDEVDVDVVVGFHDALEFDYVGV